MDGIWYKKCPQCGNYIRKIDPQEACMCCACGWEEYCASFFCEIYNKYCNLIDEGY